MILRSVIRSSTFAMHRFASHSTTKPPPKPKLHPGNQYTVEELAQGLSDKRKQQIEQLYEFEKLEINNQPKAQDEYRHNIKRLFDLNIQ